MLYFLFYSAIHRIRQWQEHKLEVENVIQNNMKKSEPCDEAMLLKAQQIDTSHAHKPLLNTSVPQAGKDLSNLSNEPTPAPRLKPGSDKAIVRQDTFVKPDNIRRSDQVPSTHDQKKVEIQEVVSKPNKPLPPLHKAESTVKKDISRSFESDKGSIQKEEVSRNLKQEATRSLEKNNSIEPQPSKHFGSINQTENQGESPTTINDDNEPKTPKIVQSKPIDNDSTGMEDDIKGKKFVIGSNDLKKSATSNAADSANSKDGVMLKSKSLSPPIPKPRRSPTRKTVSLEAAANKNRSKYTDKGSKDEKLESRKENKSSKTGEQESQRKPHVQKVPLKEEQSSGESSGSEEFSETDHGSKDEEDNESEVEDESQNESEICDKEDSAEDEASEDEEEESQNDQNDEDDENDVSGENSENDNDDGEEMNSDSSAESNDEKEEEDSTHKASKHKKSKAQASHEVEVHQKQPRDSSINETSQDSEGVVMLKSPSPTKKTSITGNDNITILHSLELSIRITWQKQYDY